MTESAVSIMLLPLLAVPGYVLYRCLGCVLLFRPQKWKKGILLLACSLIVSMVIFLGDWNNILPTFVFFLATICLSCEGSFSKRLVLGMMFASIFFTVSAIIDNYLWDSLWGYGEVLEWPRGIPWLLRLMFVSALYLLIRRQPVRPDFELSPALWRLTAFLNVVILGMVFDTVLLTSQYLDSNTLQNLVYLLLSAVSFGGLLWLVMVLERQSRMEEERMVYELNRKYYHSLTVQNEEVRRLRHDMNNHIQTALGLEGEKQREYLQKLLEQPQLSRRLKYCGDDTVNAVVSSKAAAMEQKEIVFHAGIEIGKTLAMDETDICAIFGNALDNAMEAVEKLPAKEREIRMDVRLGKGMLALKVSNPCGEETLRMNEKGLPFTTKTGALHGLGLASIREAAKKYQGSMEIRNENGIFELFVYCRCRETV